MTFNKLGLESDECKCLEGTFQDLQNIYTRKINKPDPKESDFKTQWEKATDLTVFSKSSCDDLCLDKKSLSINQWTEKTGVTIIRKYLNPYLRLGKKLKKDSIFLFRFLSDSGALKYTPTKKDKNHYDFYKSDTFSLTSLITVRIVELKETDYYKKIILPKLKDEHKYL